MGKARFVNKRNLISDIPGLLEILLTLDKNQRKGNRYTDEVFNPKIQVFEGTYFIEI